MDRATFEDVELEYEGRGAGEPVIFVHNGAGVDWFKPLLEDASLTDRYRLVSYHRVGYAGSSRSAAGVSFAEEAVHFASLMRHLEIERAHVVGHSSSGCIALQMASDFPGVVHSVVLLEPALLAVPSPAEVPEALALYRAGDKARAVDTFLRGTCGPDYGAELDKIMPGAVDQAVAGADTFFGQELPTLRAWSFGAEDAQRITQPVLAVLGAKSGPRFRRRQELLLEWLPNVESFVLPDAGHLLHLQNPRGMADGLATFFARHPMPARV
jgi:pimeloyl-ACP methyl ester carboxylesterase